MPENANAGRPLARMLPLILVLLLVAALGASAVAVQASAQGAPPEQLSEAELLSRITSAPENTPAFYAAVEVEQTVIPEGLIGASEGGHGSPDSGPRNAQIWSDGPEKLRAVLQSDNGDQVFVRNGSEVSVYDGATNTLKTGQKPEEASAAPEEKAASPEEINELLAEISPTSVLKVGEKSERVAGRWAYTLTLEPRDPDSTLVERVEAAVDAETFLPLSLELYAKGNREPVASYKAQSFVVGPQPEEQFEFETPPGAQVETLEPSEDGDHAEEARDENREPQKVASVTEAQELVDFPVRQPTGGAVGGRELTEVRVIDSEMVVLTYGTGWGTVILAQGPERADEEAQDEEAGEVDENNGREELQVPTVDIGGAEGREISTPIGTALSWSANGVSYALKGSVPSADLEEAARGLR